MDNDKIRRIFLEILTDNLINKLHNKQIDKQLDVRHLTMMVAFRLDNKYI